MVGNRNRSVSDSGAAQRLAQPPVHLHRQQRVAAEVEEVVVDADLRARCSTSRQTPAIACSSSLARRDERGGRDGAAAPVGRRQRLAVDLAVGRQREARRAPRTRDGTM